MTKSRYASRRSPADQALWKEEKEPAFMWPADRTITNALHERIGAAPLECCGETRCICPVIPDPPQPFRIRVEKLTDSGIAGGDLGLTYWAADAMTAIRRARLAFGHMYEGWSFLAVPQ